MDLESTLRSQIFALPEEDGPRLVYADWLTEQGDLRGAFIHDQVRVGSLDETTPEWSVLHARSERTLFRYRADWERPLREAYRLEDRQRPIGLVWRRGFVEGAELDLRYLAPIAPVSALAPLRAVEVTISRPLTRSDLLPILEIQPSSLSLCAPPGWLDRGGISLGSPVVGVLRTLDAPPLVSLALSGTKVFPEGISVLAKWLAPTPLRSLSLEDSALGDDGLDRLITTGLLDGLSHLALVRHRCGLRAMERLCEVPGTEPLSLSLGWMPQGDLYGAALLLQHRPLSALSLRGQHEAPALDWLLEAPYLARVRHLRLEGSFSKPGSARLRSLLGVPFEALTRLDLSSAAFGPGDFQALVDSPHLQQLVSLELRKTHVGDEGIEALVASGVTRLVELDLTACGLTNRGARLLAAWPGLASVTRLTLDGNAGLRADGLRALMHSPFFEPTCLHCTVPAIQRKGRSSRPLYNELKERFGAALRAATG